MSEAATIWYPTSGEGEYSGQSPFDIIDSTGNFLVDSTINNVTDDSTILVNTSATIWTENEGE